MADETVYAGFWVRFGAMLIDTVLLVLVTIPVFMLVYGTTWFQPGAVQDPMGTLVSHLLAAVLIIAFWLIKQATPGKMAVGARIVDARTGGTPSTGQFIGRYFAYFISIIPLCLGFLWIAFDSRKQGWHDKLAGTVVIRNANPEHVRFEAPDGP